MRAGQAGCHRAGLLIATLLAAQLSLAALEQPYPGEARVVPQTLMLRADLDDYDDHDDALSRPLAAKECQRLRLDGYATEPCLSAYHGVQALHLWFNPGKPYERKLSISSWYQSNRLGPLSLFRDRAPLLSLTTTGVRGTGVHQRLWLLLGAQQDQCRPLLLETLSAHQWVLGDADYQLNVTPHLYPARAPHIVIDYQLRRVPNEEGPSHITHRWRDTLRWQARAQRFVLSARSGRPFASAVTEIDATRSRLGELGCDDFDINGKAWEVASIMSVLDGVFDDRSTSPVSTESTP
ncbi:hypothetical protein [Chitinolyticbacter albus]|uniref:hypothetical protein n=1 Tax=Chitinolyticbacter albus TaxID=2961951 RepID=UPI00210BC85F|nr:hypothetical protein [Chitinolyticbacter albus]